MGPKSATQNLNAGLWGKAETGYYRVNNRRNSSSERRRPSSVRTSDFDLFAASQINPFSCNRSVVAQSNPFQAQRSLWSVSHNSAKTASSILSSSSSIPPCYHARDFKSRGPPRMDTDFAHLLVELSLGDVEGCLQGCPFTGKRC